MTDEGTALDYAERYQQALLGMIRDLLAEVAEEGLPGAHFFYLTFDTTAQGVELSHRLRQSHPETMTVVLQHQFWDLQVDDETLGVTLRFGGVHERLVVPWSALRAFVDPAAEFGLELGGGPGAVGGEAEADEGPRDAAAKDADREDPGDEGERDEPSKVVSLRDFKDR